MENKDADDSALPNLETGNTSNGGQVSESETRNAADQNLSGSSMRNEDADDYLPVRDLETGDANNDCHRPVSVSESKYINQNLSSGSNQENGHVNNDRQPANSEIIPVNDPPSAPESGNNIPEARLYLRSPYGSDEKTVYLEKGRSLYEAASKGDWEKANEIFENDRNAMSAYITAGWETPLHVAALENQVDFVTKLLERIGEDLQVLEIQNVNGNTALCLAAATGNLDIARKLNDRHPDLRTISGPGGTLPVMIAANLGYKDMVETLRERSDSTSWTETYGVELLKACISSGLFGIARNLIGEKPELAFSDTEVVEMLATKPMAEESKKGMKESDLQKIEALKVLKDILILASSRSTLNIENIVKPATNILFNAAEQGNFHCFKLFISYFPELVWKINTNGESMFHLAVKHHHESIFALLHNMKSVRKLVTTYVDNDGNNMLHLAATLAPKDKLNTVTGAALQMQQAICWYKAVEKIVPPAYVNMPNNDKNTPSDIFDKEHEDLLKEGEKWMKATAKSCTLVAALNATVMFTSAFTVPGGTDNKGRPYLLNKVCFQLFSISEVIGMLSSSTSIIMFLSILTSRVDKYAFRHSLPFKLMTGVTALFVSVASMVIAFCSTVYLLYGHTWVPGLLLSFPCVLILFICLKYRLLRDIIHSTSVSCFLCRSRNLLSH